MSNVTFIKVLADMTVASKQHIMPPKDSWKAPQANGPDAASQYQKGVGDSNWGMGYPAADGVTTYFATQDNNSYHKQIADSLTDYYKKFIYAQIDATEYAFNIWKPTLFFKDLKINGPTAVGSKGCLTTTADFANLYNTFPGHAQFFGKYYSKWRDAVGKGVGACLKKYIDGVTVPGLPWYPSFAAFPGPVAPPIPNTPCPLVSLPSTGLTDITDPNTMQKAILKEFDDKLKEQLNDKIHETIFLAIATCLTTGFTIWVSSQIVNLVMGTGQVPTYSLPYTPVGPVVNGQNIPSGGGNLMP